MEKVGGKLPACPKNLRKTLLDKFLVANGNSGSRSPLSGLSLSNDDVLGFLLRKWERRIVGDVHSGASAC